MKYGLSQAQLQEIITILSSVPEVEKAVIFGSRAMGNFKEASDVDIAIMGNKITFTLAAHIKSELEDETYLPFFFDIVGFNSIDNPALKEHILQEGKVIYYRNDT
jgi:predicted nucleotidyltransferase